MMGLTTVSKIEVQKDNVFCDEEADAITTAMNHRMYCDEEVDQYFKTLIPPILKKANMERKKMYRNKKKCTCTQF